jgi:hypothetical protein
VAILDPYGRSGQMDVDRHEGEVVRQSCVESELIQRNCVDVISKSAADTEFAQAHVSHQYPILDRQAIESGE